MKDIIVLSILFIIPLNLVAESGRAGNGGGGLFCSNDKSYLLDYYEAEFNEVNTFKHLNSLDSKQRLELFHSRISKFNPFFSMIIMNLRETFKNQSTFLRGVSFKIPEDYRTIFYEQNCELKVVAVQVKPFFPNENIFFINEDLWNKLDPVSQEGLINHEILYYIALGSGAENSRSVRQALAYLMSDQFSENEEEFERKFMTRITSGGFF